MTEIKAPQPAPGQFRKKPVVIEAMQWDGSWDSAEAIKAAFPTMDVCSATLHPPSQTVRAWSIRTLEGSHAVSVGDWIIKGVKGEFYPCKPDVFAMTYEPAQGAIPAPEGGRAAFESVVWRDVFGQPLTYRERELCWHAWQTALAAQPPLEDAAHSLLAILERAGEGATVADVLSILDARQCAAEGDEPCGEVWISPCGAVHYHPLQTLNCGTRFKVYAAPRRVLSIEIKNDDPDIIYLLKQYARTLQSRVAAQRRELARLNAAQPNVQPKGIADDARSAKAALSDLELLPEDRAPLEAIVAAGYQHARTLKAAAQATASVPEPHGWIVWWPAMGGGHKPIYTHGAQKPSYGPELGSKLRLYPVYDATQAPAPAPDADYARRLAEDWAGDCIKAGYVTTGARSHKVMTDAINALATQAPAVKDGLPAVLTQLLDDYAIGDGYRAQVERAVQAIAEAPRRLVSLVLDDMDTCCGEAGADYQFKELSTETIEALRAYRAATSHVPVQGSQP